MNGKIILKWTDTKTVHFLYDSYRKINRKDVIALRKPTYYLWRDDFSSQEEFEAAVTVEHVADESVCEDAAEKAAEEETAENEDI